MTQNSFTGLSLDQTAADNASSQYIGTLPPARSVMPGRISRLYFAKTTGGAPMLKVLVETTDGAYKGFNAWDNIPLTNEAAFKWGPVLAVLGITADELNKRGIQMSPVSTDVGSEVTAIGGKTADKLNYLCEWGVTYRMYEGVQQTDIAAIRPRA